MIRLGLDIGTSSIGWWLYRLENDRPVAVIDGGARIFSDGRVAKTGQSLAVARREARAARRRRDRYLRRRVVLMERLAATGLMPADPAEAKKLELLDPYAIRAQGLDEKLPLSHLGRALFHLNQRRGFKSNRKTDGADNEAGKIKMGTARLEQAMMAAGARTYGEFLHKRRATADKPHRTPSVRTRLTVAKRDNAEKEEAGYDFYPDRKHLEEELHKLWQAQTKYRPELTDELHDTLFETIFYQRPLKAPEVGLCLLTDERRLPKAHPLTQRRVLYETVNALRITSDGRAKQPLSIEDRDKIIHALNGRKHTKNLSGMKLALKALGNVIGLQPNQRFTLETAARDSIACDPVRASLSHPDRFGSRWSTFDIEEQWRIIQRLREETDPDAMMAWLREEYGLDDDHAAATAAAPLPEGYSRLGESATRNILEHLQSDVIPYSEAVVRCGYHHSDERTGEVIEALPYYGEILQRHVIPGSGDAKDNDITRYGRITNPTVHIGLNQLRRLVNRIIEVHGKPDQIVVELARELKQNDKQKAEIQRTIKKNTEAAIKRSDKLAELGQRNTGANRMILRLWEDLGEDCLKRSCPYTGKRISAEMLFGGSCDVDHILPYSRTMDDSFPNRTLCLREANREKRDRTPYETWGHDKDRWAIIQANLKNLPDNKVWRFAPDAMERFEGERDFTDRSLNDTAYLSRISKAYLEALYDGGDQKSHVWVVPGRLTEMLRRVWDLNSLLPDHNRAAKAKNRHDHRHHAIDAAVIAATDRGLIKQMADIAKQKEQEGANDKARGTEPPWAGFRDDIAEKINAILVSHRADHGLGPQRKAGQTSGQLHNDTAYGLTGENKGKVPLVVTRKPLDSLTPAMIGKIRDPYLQNALLFATQDKTDKEFGKAVQDFASRGGPYQSIRRVRIIEPIDVLEMKDETGKPYKGYKPDSNHCYEVWKMPDGRYSAQVITTFDAHQPGPLPRPHPAARRIMRLHKNDMVRLDNSKFGPVIATVEVISAATVSMVPHNESNADQRYRKDKDDVYIRMNAASLMKNGARRIFVDEMGQVRDPGPHNKR